MQKGCKNVVKELLTGGERDVASEPQAWQGVCPCQIPSVLSALPFTLLLCLFLLNLKSDLFKTAVPC